jgi:PIN domain nuclease of toxin-antitoxin system
LLDTNVLIWATMDRNRLPAGAAEVIAKASAVMVSSVSIWEIAVKVSLGKLRLDMDEMLTQLAAANAEELPLTWQHGLAVRRLPHHHRDPFDRMLVAQATTEPLQLLTSDRLLARYSDLVTVV